MIVYKNKQTISNDFDDHLLVIKGYELSKYRFDYV
jgi:hypothetical protein